MNADEESLCSPQTDISSSVVFCQAQMWRHTSLSLLLMTFDPEHKHMTCIGEVKTMWCRQKLG